MTETTGAGRPVEKFEMQPGDTERMDLLSENLRAAFALVVIEGYSYEKAAEEMKVPIGTIKSRVNRAKSGLVSARKKDAPVE